MRYAIIGSGGAGITAAWLLDGRHEVTLFERGPVLGGHARTHEVELGGRWYRADDGFSWFSGTLYPHFMRLLQIHGVATRSVRMTATLTNVRLQRTMVMPPSAPGPLLQTIASPSMLADLLRLNGALSRARSIVHGRRTEQTYGEFLRQHAFGAEFEREVLTPFVLGCWGAPYDAANDLSVYPLMKYLVVHRPSAMVRHEWHVVRDGASSYIQAIAARLRTTRIERGLGVEALVRGAGGWTVVDTRGGQRAFDGVLFATGSRDARAILERSEGAGEAKAALAPFRTYAARLCTHSDASLLPARRRDWRIANIRFTGDASRLHVWVGQPHGVDLFTSYVGEKAPERCHALSTFHLPLLTPAHYRAQAALHRMQGRDGLWFAGDWTRDIGSHEDAVTSAMTAVETIDPRAPRLAALRAPRAVAQALSAP